MRRQRTVSQERVEALKDVFKKLRKQGFLARMNFSCCASCAGFELAEIAEGLIDAGKRSAESIKGAVYYHRQDKDSMYSSGWLHIRYCSLTIKKNKEIGIDAKKIGEAVCALLKNAKLGYMWNGDSGKTIQVDMAVPSINPVPEDWVKRLTKEQLQHILMEIIPGVRSKLEQTFLNHAECRSKGQTEPCWTCREIAERLGCI